MEDTIAAISTAYGEGGIGIVRMSGPDSLDILKSVFAFAGQASDIVSRRMTYGKIVDDENGETIDEVLVVYMKAPKTYTAEDIVEIDCHGSVVSLRKVLSLLLHKGARLAEPGEFTKRAFLNGRLDLSQAEAVIDVVRAKTDNSFDAAMSQLEGRLSAEIKDIRKQLLDLLVDVTVNIDYPDEDIEELSYKKLVANISLIGETIEKLLSTANTGRMIREGIRIAIVGKPNVGKSSLMNALLKESRAIVTDVPGTTRDTIEEALSIRGLPVYLVDTAGIRDTSDDVERLGIERSKVAAGKADLVIFIVDGSRPISREDENIAAQLEGRKPLVIVNKNDLDAAFEEEAVRHIFKDRGGDLQLIKTSLPAGEGLDEIEAFIENMVYAGKLAQKDSVMVSNVRHTELLRKGREALTDALQMAKAGEALDFIEVDVRNAYEHLGEIIGETVTDDIIDEVFSRFCLGK